MNNIVYEFKNDNILNHLKIFGKFFSFSLNQDLTFTSPKTIATHSYLGQKVLMNDLSTFFTQYLSIAIKFVFRGFVIFNLFGICHQFRNFLYVFLHHIYNVYYQNVSSRRYSFFDVFSLYCLHHLKNELLYLRHLVPL